MKKIDKCLKKFKVVKSKNFKGMYAITKNGKLWDEPHSSKIKARNQIKRYGGCK